ncbi:Nif3-like dinuclear metal center hexameric protein [Alicyclobacillus sp. SO9]|uniref:Nif3-like dinuclear metal center hexameric protein n=1 Tax=Alicyclobacillus sp. SO9 TaxID=2665646 RepID=UPI0018E88098|nr:Nif3-like dinuclear metal center hexameric protein [Alicyclobacillus sp. SO9]QQE77323.1 Nif3-like dinuclear metal center hexameric protein [Alicyclobacillus sp. SO9]
MTHENLTARDITAALDDFAPASLAMEGDKIGLQVGRLEKPVQSVLLSLDPSPEVIDYAVAGGYDLLLTHHAMLFRPIQRLDTSTARGKAVAKAVGHDITVYNAHTNLDVAEGGVNDVLAELLQLKNVTILERMANEELRKLVVFVPKTHHEEVFQAVCNAGAGHIGAYSHCTFNTPGTGTFLPEEGTNPFLGTVGKIERADEVRLETIVPMSKVETVIRAMISAHPYEEVAYDLYPLQIMGKEFGIGRIGTLSQTLALSEFSQRVKAALGLKHVRFSGNPDMPVRTVAVVGGAGGDFVEQAMAKGADVFVTSDCDHHLVAEAWQDGLAMIDTTHAAMERPVLKAVQTHLQTRFQSLKVDIADLNEDPFTWL